MSKETNVVRGPDTTKSLEELYQLIDKIEVAMFTTRRPDGRLVSRPMQTQPAIQGADLWFVADIETDKFDELAGDPNVNLAYYRNRTREWVSVSGTASVSQDRRAIRELWKPDWRAWFGNEGPDRDGGPDDPRLALILIEAQSVSYLKVDKPKPLVLFEVAKGLVTGQRPDIGEVKTLTDETERP